MQTNLIMGDTSTSNWRAGVPDRTEDQGPVVQRLDNSIHWINHYPADSVVCFVNSYPLDSDLSGG